MQSYYEIWIDHSFLETIATYKIWKIVVLLFLSDFFCKRYILNHQKSLIDQKLSKQNKLKQFIFLLFELKFFQKLLNTKRDIRNKKMSEIRHYKQILIS